MLVELKPEEKAVVVAEIYVMNLKLPM